MDEDLATMWRTTTDIYRHADDLSRSVDRRLHETAAANLSPWALLADVVRRALEFVRVARNSAADEQLHPGDTRAIARLSKVAHDRFDLRWPDRGGPAERRDLADVDGLIDQCRRRARSNKAGPDLAALGARSCGQSAICTDLPTGERFCR